MTPAQRRVVLAVCLTVGLTLLVSAGLTFLIEPLADDLALSDSVVEDVLAIPSVAALIMVFSAGQLGDRLGARRTLVIASAAFSVGAAVLALSSHEYPVEIGLAICSAAAVTIQIVGISLLQQATVSGPAQVSAFTSLGAVFPFAFLVFPVATAWLLGIAPWRLVPVVWVVAGVVMMALAMLLVESGERRRSGGEWLTPLLAGLAFAAGARAVAELDDVQTDPIIVVLALAVCIVAGIACFALTRRSTASFTTVPIRDRQLPWLLLAVALVTLSGLLTYVSIALEYLYDMTPYEAALAVVPAQIGAILGAKFLAGRMMHRWGGVRAAGILMLGLAVAALPLLLLSVGSPVAFLVGVATVFSFVWMATLTVLNSEVMRRAPRDETGAVSSFRTAASSLGTTAGVGVLGAIVLSTVPVDAEGAALATDQLIALTNSLRLDGLLASLIAVVGWGVMQVVRRRSDPRVEVVGD